MEDTSGDAAAMAQSDSSHHHEDDPKGKKPANVRKRTKTGCLTCRKRRIKCDENKPTCNNCVKSRRLCEGYSQRVIFKEPIAGIQGTYGPSLYTPGSTQLPDPLLALQARNPSQIPLQPIAPKPDPYSHGQPGTDQLSQAYLSQSPHEGTGSRAPAYSFNENSYPPAGDTRLPNPLMTPGISKQPGGLGERGPPQHYGLENDNAGEGPSNWSEQGSKLVPDQRDDDLNVSDDNNSEVFDNIMLAHTVDVDLTRQSLPAQVPNLPMTPFGGYDESAESSTYLSASIDYSQYLTLLNDETKQESMTQFIKVTGPTLSMYERAPFDYNAPRQFTPDGKPERSTWSWTFPVKAACHRPLMYAMLSLGDLQKQYLEGHQPLNAWRYYHKAVQSLKKYLTWPHQRRTVETLAATLLLAYHEVWSSDHTKWCRHLKGASILLKEIPLSHMSRIYLPLKRMKDLGCAAATGQPEYNYALLSIITGSHVSAEQFGLRQGQPLEPFSYKAVDTHIMNYDYFCDIFWWYCKMDVYQSILGGTKLFMPYDLWTQCPPRAPISATHAVYGTYDHVILLLGRVANFSSRDLSRKRRMTRNQGGPPGSSPPPFPGMLPAQEKVRAPEGFASGSHRDTSPPSDTNDETEMPNIEAAIQEWGEIRKAFDIFESSLGIGFQPLSGEFQDRRDTPFGKPLQYRSYAVAGIWLNFYMGLICLHRSHPNMPPAAMQAARIVASQTAWHAKQIGRIAAGLVDNISVAVDISVTLAAALVESSFCIFVAAIQFQDVDQRYWVLQRMRDVGRLTGWQSAQQVAKGCESAWAKAAQLGQGPPYVRPAHFNEDPMWVWMNPRRIDQEIGRMDHGERRLVLHAEQQAHYALGLLGVEEDLEVLDLNE